MENKTNINDRSINSAGIPADYKQAVAEFIWNGFDAGATQVDIRFSTNEVDHIERLEITDNGCGIEFETLNNTFGAFLDSVKKNSFQRSSYVRGKKGKGRFSFAAFAGKATWHTTYLKGDKYLSYDIDISKHSKDRYNDTKKKVSDTDSTGTSVILTELFEVSSFSFSSEEFRDYLAQQFGWFLFLNEANSYSLSINDEPVEFDYLIADSDVRKLTITDRDGKNYSFLINYIRWHDAIGERYYYYFLDNEKRESAKKLTSYNNNAIGFHHSVFVQSDFFDNFILSEDDPNSSLFEKDQTNPVFKEVLVGLNEFLVEKQKLFIRETAADDLVKRMETKGVFPKFGRGKYDAQRKEDLVSVVKELYIVEPKIFKTLNKQQEVTFLGFLNLLLDSEEREKILEIIDGLVILTSDERDELSQVLKKTNFSKISKTIRLIESRFEVVELLRMLVFDNKKFTTERDHIQACIEENYWLFGEQFHLVSADQNFQTALSKYLHLIDGVEGKEKVSSYDWKRRPDIFICRKRNITDPRNSDSEIEENIMVELKRPTVTIGKNQLRQVDDYFDLILKEDGFNSELRTWKFFVVSNKVDDYIKNEYEAFADKGKRFLVKKVGRYEIYAMTWDDVFKSFEIKHNYLLDKLSFDKSALQTELKNKGVNLGRDGSDLMTKQVVNLSKN